MQAMEQSLHHLGERLNKIKDDKNDDEAPPKIDHKDVTKPDKYNGQKWDLWAKDFKGFPSTMIEGSYDLANNRMHTYNRVVIATGAPPARKRYLVQFTVTGYAEQAVADAPDMEKIIEGFTVSVPGAAPATR